MDKMRTVKFTGAADEGRARTAKFTAALRVDKPRLGSLTRKRGQVLAVGRAIDEIVRLRTEQVGKLGASATITRCEGRWLGRASERTIECEIEHVPSPNELRVPAFRRHMLDLAEKIALRFGQEEVWLRMGGRLYRANAPGERIRPLRRGGHVVR